MQVLDDPKRRSRNIFVAALLALLIIWTVKLSFPQHTVASVYTHVRPGYANSSTPQSQTQPATDRYAKSPHSSAPGTIALAQGIHDAFNNTKAAVIIETRYRTNLIPLILHFSSVLGPTWPILIYTSAEAIGLFAASAALNRYLQSGQIQIRLLPQTVLFTNSDSVNAFLTKKWLWESLEPAENILIFQSDSMICANAARSVDDYFAYDFVGAPIAKELGNGYNGGLSLRKRSSTMRVLGEWDWETTQTEGDRFEDQWYFNRFAELQKRELEAGISPDADGAINLPSMEVARTFAVETIDYPHPLGVHQVHRWLQAQMASLDAWCPEYKLCSEDYIQDT